MANSAFETTTADVLRMDTIVEEDYASVVCPTCLASILFEKRGRSGNDLTEAKRRLLGQHMRTAHADLQNPPLS